MISKPQSLLKTDVTFIDYDHDKLISVKKHRTNMTVLGGRLNFLESPFGITPDPSKHLYLNNMIPAPKNASDTSPINYLSVNHSITPESLFTVNGAHYNSRFERRVGWWCIGEGAEHSTVPYEINDAHPWETRLYGMVPFRFVKIPGADLSPQEKAKYRLRVEVTLDGQTYAAYYAKAFDVGQVHSVKNEEDYIPNINDSIPYEDNGVGHPMVGKTSFTYVEFALELEAIEFKEYYRATHNGQLALARLSELGLITGLDKNNELACAELYAKMTHDVVFLTSEGARRTVQYRIYS